MRLFKPEITGETLYWLSHEEKDLKEIEKRKD